MAGDVELSSDRVKHLEFIQTVISRMATNSFLIKGWSLTLAGILFAVAAGEGSAAVALLTLVPIVAFWLMDGYLLYHERLFRHLYDDARKIDSTVEPFALDIRPYRDSHGLVRAALSVTLMLCHGPIMAAGVALAIIQVVTG